MNSADSFEMILKLSISSVHFTARTCNTYKKILRDQLDLAERLILS